MDKLVNCRISMNKSPRARCLHHYSQNAAQRILKIQNSTGKKIHTAENSWLRCFGRSLDPFPTGRVRVPGPIPIRKSIASSRWCIFRFHQLGNLIGFPLTFSSKFSKFLAPNSRPSSEPSVNRGNILFQITSFGCIFYRTRSSLGIPFYLPKLTCVPAFPYSKLYLFIYIF